MKKTLCLVLLCLIPLLSGCSSIENILLERAEIQKDVEYQSYQDMQARGELDRDGQFINDSLLIAGPAKEDSRCFVSFGENRYLEPLYFQDAAFSVPVSTGYLDAGIALKNQYVTSYTIKSISQEKLPSFLGVMAIESKVLAFEK